MNFVNSSQKKFAKFYKNFDEKRKFCERIAKKNLWKLLHKKPTKNTNYVKESLKNINFFKKHKIKKFVKESRKIGISSQDSSIWSKNVPSPFLPPKNANFVKWLQKCYFRQKIAEQMRFLSKNRKQNHHTNFVKWSIEKLAIFPFCSLLLVDGIHCFQLLTFTCFLGQNDKFASFLIFSFQSYSNFYACLKPKIKNKSNKKQITKNPFEVRKTP